MKPLIVINLKTYETGTGKKALNLAKLAEEVSISTGSKFIFCVQPTDIRAISSQVKIPIYAQHIDPITYGSNTGYILPESVKSAGAKGTLLNHAERKIDHKILKTSISIAKDKGLKVIACADSVKEANQIAHFSPDYIAIEPPELIGGDISVSTAKPQIITGTIDAVKKVDLNIKVLVGAGIKTSLDVKKSVELGAAGVLLASGVTRAKSPKKVMQDLVSLV
ncbi:MAG: triose-phosphate isomerase [Candidatus Aenigmarchaeota archaeon]|nr:triose-phosphate isomerase [Candidatus Aenigmarchaeota archaeon]